MKTKETKPVLGILAVQGDFALHAAALDRLGAPHFLVKHPEQLTEVSGLSGLISRT